MSSPRQAQGWMTHIMGEIALFRANGPGFYATGSAHRLFVDDRLFLVRNGIMEGLPSV
jgi:hypothetical protein